MYNKLYKVRSHLIGIDEVDVEIIYDKFNVKRGLTNAN